MLNLYRNIIYDKLLVRCINTSSYFCKSNKEWVAMQRQIKMKKDLEWNKREAANPFQTNIGMRHQMKALGFRDISDPKVVSRLDFREIGYEEELNDKLEETIEMTDKYNDELNEHKKKRSSLDRAVLRRKLTRKKFMPSPQIPNLLTVMDKLTMKNLYDSDPAEWTPERLSECFPATVGTISRFVRKRFLVHPSAIQKHDQIVRENWQKLLDGDLQVSPGLMKQLVENHDKIGLGVKSYMSDVSYKQLEESIIQDYETSYAPMKRENKGEFGLIISDYNKKLQAIKNKNSPSKPEGDRTEMVVDKSLLAEEHPHHIDMPSPFGGSTLLRTDLNYRNERSMTMAQFKKKFLDRKMKKLAKTVASKPDGNEDVKAYVDWFNTEERKAERARLNPVTKLSEKEIEVELEMAQKDRFIQLPKKYNKQKSANLICAEGEDEAEVFELGSKGGSKGEIQLKVEIPQSDYKSGAIYKINNCYYDSNGDFLYRAPSST